MNYNEQGNGFKYFGHIGSEFDTEVLIEKLLFVNEVERGMKDVRDGKTIPLEEAKQRLKIK